MTVLALGLLVSAPWTVVSGGVGQAETANSQSLEGIWTTMIPTPSGHASINSFVIDAQGSEGLAYTVIGQHPQCSPTLLGYFPESERLSDMLGSCVQTGDGTFAFSVIWYGVREGGPEQMGLGDIVFMGVMAGTLERIDADTLLFAGVVSAYAPDQDVDGDRLPDEGAVPVLCMPGELPLKRLPMFPSCEPTPIPE
jgi:hypothetical protein